MADAKQMVQQQFGPHARNYVTSEGHAKGYSLGRLIELIPPQPHWHVLDIATGGGHTALKFAPHVAQTVVTDLTRPMIETAREHLQSATDATMCFARCDAEVLPFPDAAFDLVTCRLAPHHFPDVQQFVFECSRVVKPGGIVAVVDTISPPDKRTAHYVNAFERLRDPSHGWAFSLEAWGDFFQLAGLEVTHRERYALPQNLVEYADRLGCSALTRQRLRAMLLQAPPPVKEWLAPQSHGDGEAIRFYIQQGIIVGRRSIPPAAG